MKTNKNSRLVKKGHDKDVGGMATISSLFEQQRTKEEPIKSGAHVIQKDIDYEEDKDIVFIGVQNEGQLNNSSSSAAILPSPCTSKRITQNMEAEVRKKRKLSLSQRHSKKVKNEADSSVTILSNQAEVKKCVASSSSEGVLDNIPKLEEKSSNETKSSTSTINIVEAGCISDDQITRLIFSDSRDTLTQGESTGLQLSGNNTSDAKTVPDTKCSPSQENKFVGGQESNESVLPGPSDKSSHSNDLNEDSVNAEEDIAKDTASYAFSSPYYFNNFETILSSVMNEETYAHLFNEEDMNVINKYHLLSDAAKKMYIRIFSRKLNWIPIAKLNYPEIGNDLKPFLVELVNCQFLQDDKNMTDLREVLEAISAADMKTLAKVYHLPSALSQKSQQIQELLKRTQRTNISSMFGVKGQSGLAQSMLTRAKKFLDGVYRLTGEARAVFMRVMMLFSVVNTSIDEDSGIGGQGQLFQMLMVNMGKVVYPEYHMEKTHSIFSCREDILRFSEALQLESDMLHATEKGKWEDAYTVLQAVQERKKVLEDDEEITRHNKSLPDFLRGFTATSVIYRLLSQGIEILQRKKDFEGAIDLLHSLLDQKIYCCTHRGYWWERLALNLDAHLKKPEQSLEAVLSGLADSHVQVGHRLALYQRGQAICQRPKLKLGHRLQECVHESVRDLPKVYLEGRVLHSSTGAGPRFLTHASYRSDGGAGDGMGDLAVCGVEEFVLDHYRINGFPSGMHAEGSVVTSLFALYFWDILFLPKPDAFHSPYQAMPLDLYSTSFYDRRKIEIDERLEKLANSTVEDLQTMAEDSWQQHEDVFCVGMSWERMRSADCVKELVGCIGPHNLSGILKRYAHCPRHTRSGFPDLTLWNAATGAFKICEVKGPGDRLSHKQILWIDHLLKLGIDAEVCHVKAVAAKRLIPT